MITVWVVVYGEKESIIRRSTVIKVNDHENVFDFIVCEKMTQMMANKIGMAKNGTMHTSLFNLQKE